MSVYNPAAPLNPEEEAETEFEIVDEDLEGVDGLVIDTETGTVVAFDVEEGELEHDANLADYMDEEDLMALATEVISGTETDQRARSDWARAYVQGMDLLGLKAEDRTEPWEGACGVFHPMLTEAVVRFQAQAMAEMFPASGPARTKIVGKQTPEKTKQAQRVENELNYLLTEEMTEYRDELEQMLFQLPLAGSAFRKVYYDPITERPVSMFVPAEDFIAPYGSTDLMTCERYTHVMKKSEVEVLQLQMSGFYRAVELPAPTPEFSDIQDKQSELAGEEAMLDDDDRHTILEAHVTMNLPEEFDDPEGVPRPYIITVDKSSSTVLAVRRNWYEDDPKKLKRQHFTHYKYLPGLGFYGFGLIHMIGGLTKSATSILRQLVDAGTLANIPAGFKAQGARIKGDTTPLRPGEFRDIDVGGQAIRDALHPLPFGEPSAVLYQLLGNVVEEGRRVGSIADLQVGNMNPEAPVGTTLALLERSMKVMTGVQARLHAAARRELKLIASVIYDFMGPQYAHDQEGDFDRKADFDGRVDVIPVSDPNAATMAQRVVQYQAALQLAQQAPHLYDMGKLHRGMLEVLNIQDADEIIKLPGDLKPMDPVTENMALLKQEPVKAFEYQDHEAHIAVHMAAAQDPKILQLVGQSPFASAIQSAMASHITEHVAMGYRAEIQKQLGAPMPASDAELPEDVEREVSRLAAQAADKLLRRNQAEAQQQAQQQAEQDPLNQIQRAEIEIKQREVALKEAEAKHRAAVDMEKLRLDAQKAAGNLAIDEAKIEAENERKDAELATRIATDIEKTLHEDQRAGAKMGMDIVRGEGDGRTGGAPAPDRRDDRGGQGDRGQRDGQEP